MVSGCHVARYPTPAAQVVLRRIKAANAVNDSVPDAFARIIHLQHVRVNLDGGRALRQYAIKLDFEGCDLVPKA